eukprot:765915-Hanusia_phi.AAC.3
MEGEKEHGSTGKDSGEKIDGDGGESKARLLCYGLDGKVSGFGGGKAEYAVTARLSFDRHHPISDSVYEEIDKVCSWYLLIADQVRWKRLEEGRVMLEGAISKLRKEAPTQRVLRVLNDQLKRLNMLREEESHCKHGFVKVGIEISLNGREISRDDVLEVLDRDPKSSLPAVVRVYPQRVGLGDGALINVLCYEKREKTFLDRFCAFLPFKGVNEEMESETMTVGDMIQIFDNIYLQRREDPTVLKSESRLSYYKQTLDSSRLARDIFRFRSAGEVLQAEDMELFVDLDEQDTDT